MAFNVRVHAYRGLKQIHQQVGDQYAADSVKMLSEPYLWGQTLVSNGGTAVELSPDSMEGVKCIRVEVADGQAIRYEINPAPGTASEREASVDSPKLSGIDVFDFHPGWGFSFIDAVGT